MKKNKGMKGDFIGIIWTLIVIGILLAAFQIMGVSSMEKGFNYIKDKALHYSKCIPSGDCGIIKVVSKVDPSGDKIVIDPSGDKIIIDPSGDKIVIDSNNTDKVYNNGQLNLEVLISRDTPGHRGPAQSEPYITNSGLVRKEIVPVLMKEVNVVKDKDFEKASIDYSRREWKHWTSNDGRKCWNTRNEILHRDAVPGTVKYVDKFIKEAAYENACAIGSPKEDKGELRLNTDNSGKWICPYSGIEITNSTEIDIDHIIPLSYAAKAGGQSWSAEKKEAFANDPDNLLATSAKENRSKGDKGPSEYMPPLRAYRCNYAKAFGVLVHKYNLNISESDLDEIQKTLKACKY